MTHLFRFKSGTALCPSGLEGSLGPNLAHKMSNRLGFFCRIFVCSIFDCDDPLLILHNMSHYRVASNVEPDKNETEVDRWQREQQEYSNRFEFVHPKPQSYNEKMKEFDQKIEEAVKRLKELRFKEREKQKQEEKAKVDEILEDLHRKKRDLLESTNPKSEDYDTTLARLEKDIETETIRQDRLRTTHFCPLGHCPFAVVKFRHISCFNIDCPQHVCLGGGICEMSFM